MKSDTSSFDPETFIERRSKKWSRFYPLLLLLAGWLAYSNSFSGPFIFDDTTSVFNNPYMKKLWPISFAMRGLPQTTAEPRPVVCYTLAINYAISGMNPWSYHALNLLTHLLNAIFIYLILRRTLREERLGGRFQEESAGLAVIVALLWVTHPLLTDAVDYVIQRTELLMALFFLLMFYCMIRGVRSRYRLAWYVMAILMCELGMGSKEIMVVAPLLMLLYDRIFLASSWREVFRERWWVYLGFVSTGFILYMVTKYAHRVTVGFNLGVSPWDYLKTQAGVITYYLRLSFWPSPLSLDYEDWPIARDLVSILPQGILIVSLLAATGWALVRKPAVGFLGAWFFLILAPTSSVLPIVTEIVGERRMYLSLASVLTLVVIGVYAGGVELERRRGWTKGRWRRYMLYLAVGIVGIYVRQTFARNIDYQTDLSIWTDTVEKRPRNIRARFNLISALGRGNQKEKVIDQLQAILQVDSNHAQAQERLAFLYMEMKNLELAQKHCAELIRILPASPNAHNNMGVVLMRQGKLDDAIAQFLEALRLKPDYPEAKRNLGGTMAKKEHPGALTPEPIPLPLPVGPQEKGR